MAYKLKIKNVSDRVIERLGFVFEPGKEKEVEVSSARDVLHLRAPRGLEVEEVKGPKKAKDDKPSEKAKK